MKVMVIGSGGREHALVWKLAQSPRVDRMWCLPGNGGIGMERLSVNQRFVECVDVGAEDLSGVAAFAGAHRPDLVVVAPDNPLALGMVDLLQRAGFRAWGPNQQAAQFEASKAFAQDFMQRHGIPTAEAGVFRSADPAKAFVRRLEGRCAVKADGLALGKGVLLCGDVDEACRAIDSVLVHKAFGRAGECVVIQEFLQGTEVSLHALCDGSTFRLFPTSQDHKQAFDEDQGPNTGGMGTYSPTPFLDEAQLREVERLILKPWLDGCRAEGIDYRGILYPGLMLTDRGPKVLEFNARFGDPETQVYLTRLENDLVDLMESCLDGTLDQVQLRWAKGASVCVVMASGGYPGSYAKGKRIDGLDAVAGLPNVKVFHAGSRCQNGECTTSGGRVLGVTAWSQDLAAARESAYQAVGKIHFEGAHFRRDIAAKGLAFGAARMSAGPVNPGRP